LLPKTIILLLFLRGNCNGIFLSLYGCSTLLTSAAVATLGIKDSMIGF